VKLGAIVVVKAAETLPASVATIAGREALASEPLGLIDVLGRSVTERLVERLLSVGVEAVSVLVERGTTGRMPVFRTQHKNVKIQIVADLASAVAEELSEFADKGIDHSFVHSSESYSETDLLDFLYFHKEARQSVTRAFDSDGPLALWVADCTAAQQSRFDFSLEASAGTSPSYFVREYVNRISGPHDLRKLAEDALNGRVECGPSGKEIRPGVWLDEGAEIHRGARVVAPAYIGCKSKIMDDALVTRGSSIEKNCYVDCGTVVENSSILADTYIGIWLDVCHAVVNGNKILSLERNVMVELFDPTVMRSTFPVRAADKVVSNGEKPLANLDLGPMAALWQFGANFIQE
jgi:NDP-sugar pyrophosphorylase family protein